MRWDPEKAAYGSFAPYLAWAVSRTTGPILELGAGYYSTPYLHGLSLERLVVTYEFDREFAADVRDRFGGSRHRVFSALGALPLVPWSVVLVDCEGWNRQAFFNAVAPRTEIIVVHDSQDPWVRGLERFRYRAEFDECPQTTLVSNSIDVTACGR